MKLNQPDLQAALLCGEAVIFDEIDSTNEYLLRQYARLSIKPLGVVAVDGRGIQAKTRIFVFLCYGVIAQMRFVRSVH